jgi:hypothetical protein
MCNDDAPSAGMSRPARRTTPSGKRVGAAPGEVSRRLVAPREGPNPRNQGTAALGQLVDSLEEALRTPMECGPLESVVWGCALAEYVSVQRSDYAIGFRTRAQGPLSGRQGAGPAQRSLEMALGPPCNWQRRAFHAARHATPPARRGRLVDLTVTVTVPLAACALTRSALPAREASRTPVPCAGTLGRAPCSSRAAGPLLFQVHRALRVS